MLLIINKEETKIFDFRFDWSESINVNVGQIDDKHRQIFRIGRDIEQLIRIQCIGVEKWQILDIVGGLRESIIYSFCEEEQFMWRYEYSDREAHQKKHEKYAKKIYNINCAVLKAHPVDELVRIKNIITEWTLEHMLTEDKKMADEIRGRLIE